MEGIGLTKGIATSWGPSQAGKSRTIGKIYKFLLGAGKPSCRRPSPVLPFLDFWGFIKEKPQIYQGFSVPTEPTKSLENTEKTLIDERQITHLICARLKYDLYDFLGGVLRPFIQEREQEAGPKHP